MALKKLPGGVVVETDGGAYPNEESGVIFEAIHRQIVAGVPTTKLAQEAAATAESAANRAVTVLSSVEARLAALEQDTGNVKITSASVKSATLHPTISTIRRRGRLVTLALGWQSGPAGSAVIMSLPEWARPATSMMTKSTGGANMFIRSGVSNDVYGYNMTATTENQYIDVAYFTDAAFGPGPYTA